jgi:hypothetical protein
METYADTETELEAERRRGRQTEQTNGRTDRQAGRDIDI